MKGKVTLMKTSLAITIVCSVLALAGGCATKKYVRMTTEPIQAKVDQVGDQATKNAASIEETKKEIAAVDSRAETGISAARERALAAQNKAEEALKKGGEAAAAAAEARARADKGLADVEALRNQVSKIEDYQPVVSTTVQFPFGKDKLTPEAIAALDKLAADKGNLKSFVVVVEGYTDSVGNPDYNAALSRRRADAVTNYLITKHDIPLYRVYTTGLGNQRPVDEGKTREARSKNRRVKVDIFSSDAAMAAAAAQRRAQ